MDFTLIYITRHILISSRNFRLSCFPWISHTICLSLILLSFPPCSIRCFLYPVYFHIHPDLHSLTVTLTSSTVRLSFSTPVCHNQTHISVFLFAGLSTVSFFVIRCVRGKHPQSILWPPPPLSLCLPRLGVEAWGFTLIRTLLALPAWHLLTALQGSLRCFKPRATRDREQIPDVDMTKPVPESWGRKRGLYSSPADYWYACVFVWYIY